MAGIDALTIASAAKGTALDLGGAAGVAGVAAGLSSPLGLVSTGLGILRGAGGLFGSSKSQSNQSAAYSGGTFQSDNEFDFSYSKPFFELDNPVHVAVAGGLIILAIYTYKKVK